MNSERKVPEIPAGYNINLKDENNVKLWITGNLEALFP